MLELLIIGFSTPNIPAPQPAPPPPNPEDSPERIAEREVLLEEEKKIQRGRRGRGSTILTSGLGVTGEANVARKTLLGQ